MTQSPIPSPFDERIRDETRPDAAQRGHLLTPSPPLPGLGARQVYQRTPCDLIWRDPAENVCPDVRRQTGAHLSTNTAACPCIATQSSGPRLETTVALLAPNLGVPRTRRGESPGGRVLRLQGRQRRSAGRRRRQSVSGSSAATSNSMPRTKRVAAVAPARPMAAPSPASVSASRRTRRRTFAAWPRAPRAAQSRDPLADVRRHHRIEANGREQQGGEAKDAEQKCVEPRPRERTVEQSGSNGVTRMTCTSGSAAFTASRASEAARSVDARSAQHEHLRHLDELGRGQVQRRPRSWPARDTASARRLRRPYATGSRESGPPILSRLPIGSSPGHVRAATSSLTIATSMAPARSAAVKARPRTERHLERPEIVVVHRFEIERRVDRGALGALALRGEARHIPAAVTRERQHVDGRRGSDRGRASSRATTVLEKLRPTAAVHVLLRMRQRQLDEQQTIRREPDVDRLQAKHAPRHQSCGRNDTYGERHLSDDESPAAAPRRPHSPIPGPRSQGRHEIDAHRPYRRATPASMDVASATATVNSTTVGSIRTDSMRGSPLGHEREQPVADSTKSAADPSRRPRASAAGSRRTTGSRVRPRPAPSA